MKVYGILDNFLTSFGSFVENVKDDENRIKKVKSAFDYIHKRWFLRSSFISRSFYKPRGYPGDYILLERIYVNKPRGIGIDRIMDKFSLNRPGAKSIRMRKALAIKLMMKMVYGNNPANGRINILDVGAGSGRISRQFLNQLEDKYREKIHITLLDHDKDALSFARKGFTSRGLRAGYVRENIINMIRNGPADNLKGQDIILSVGLFDYLSDRLFASGIQSLYKLLSRNGTLIVANLSKDYPNRFELEWLTHWHLIYRDRNDMLRIIEDANLENHTVSIVTEPQCGVFFCIVKKDL